MPMPTASTRCSPRRGARDRHQQEVEPQVGHVARVLTAIERGERAWRVVLQTCPGMPRFLRSKRYADVLRVEGR